MTRRLANCSAVDMPPPRRRRPQHGQRKDAQATEHKVRIGVVQSLHGRPLLAQHIRVVPCLDGYPSYRRNYLDVNNWPFQIPLGAFLPQRVENLLPANKNIGTTHITNGCYRLHPVEWNIGEAAGALAAYCLTKDLAPRQVRNTPALLADFQKVLVNTLGFELAWPEPLRSTSREKSDPLGV